MTGPDVQRHPAVTDRVGHGASPGFVLSDVRHLSIHVVGEVDHLGAARGAIRDWFGGEVPPATLLGIRCRGHPDQLVEFDATVLRER